MKIRSFFRGAALAGAACAALCSAPFASSTVLVTTDWAAPPPLNFSIISPVVTANESAGAFTGTFGGTPIIFWCFELNQFFNLGGTYTTEYAAQPLSNGPLGQLFNQHIGGATASNVTSAAFQLAVWEILYDSGPYDVTTGAFRASGNAAAISLANTWLSGLSGPTRVVTLLHAANNQDFVTVGTPGRDCCLNVPEPSTVPLLGLAFAGMAFIVSRRNRKSSGLLGA